MRKLLFITWAILFPVISYSQHYKKDGTPDMRYKENKTYSTTPRTYTHTSTYHHKSNYSYSASRDQNGRIKRSASAKYRFMKQTGYPHGRKGYVIDHIVPLKEGGCDCPSNMQWQTKEQARQKR